LFLVGDVWSIILTNLLAMCLMAAFFLGIAVIKTKRSLE
jgi:hypothetical protein